MAKSTYVAESGKTSDIDKVLPDQLVWNACKGALLDGKEATAIDGTVDSSKGKMVIRPPIYIKKKRDKKEKKGRGSDEKQQDCTTRYSHSCS